MNLEAQQAGYLVSNAGLPIIVNFLPGYFWNLGLMVDKEFKDDEAAFRATLLVQYLIHGDIIFREQDLMLNKLICGVELDEPISELIEITPKESEESEHLLKTIIDQWEILKKTSINGLRESFLIREGNLAEKNGSWHLQVESKTIDILLQHIPWSVSLIKLPWMKHKVNVEWA